MHSASVWKVAEQATHDGSVTLHCNSLDIVVEVNIFTGIMNAVNFVPSKCLPQQHVQLQPELYDPQFYDIQLVTGVFHLIYLPD